MEPKSKDSIKERKNFIGETILFFDYTEKLFGEIPANDRINVILCEQFNDTLKIMLDTMLIAEGYFKTNESTGTVLDQDIIIPRDIAKNKKLLFLNNKNEILCVIQLRKVKNPLLSKIFSKNNQMVHKKRQEIFLPFFFFCRLKNNYEINCPQN